MKTLTILQLVVITLTMSLIFGITNMAAQPVNDLIENAINLNFGPTSPYGETDVDFPAATNANDHTPASGCGVSQPGIWYTFTATKEGNVAAGILNPDSAVVLFYEGPLNATDGMQLLYVDQNTNPCGSNPLANIDVQTGTTYYIYMRNLANSDVNINASGAFQVPYNDLITNAPDIGATAQPFIENNIHFLMTTATNDGGQTNCNSGNFDGIWYKITAQIAGTIEAVMEGSPAGESSLVFYTAPDENATSGTELTWVNQVNNICGLNNTSSINAEAGLTYYLYAFSGRPYANVIINAGAVLGIAENILEGFEFYPNPVTNRINLSAKSTIDKISIFNLLGQKIYSEKMNATKYSIDLSSLEPGMYVMTATSEGITASYKILKN